LAPALQLGHRVVDAEAVGGEIGEKTIDETAKLGGAGFGIGGQSRDGALTPPRRESP